MRALLSILVALVLAAAIHVDWHLARPHVHGGLSAGLPYHWLFAIPVFALSAWYIARRNARLALTGVVTIGVAVLLGQGLEPLVEYVAYGTPIAEVFRPARVGAFAVFLGIGVATYAAMTWR